MPERSGGMEGAGFDPVTGVFPYLLLRGIDEGPVVGGKGERCITPLHVFTRLACLGSVVHDHGGEAVLGENCIHS